MLNGDQYTMLMKEAYYNPELSDAASDIPEFNYDPSFAEYEHYNNEYGLGGCGDQRWVGCKSIM